MVAIKIENLCKNYNGKIALDNINLDIPKGSFFALLGPNGAGKSTLINIIAGLTKKTSGKITIENYDLDLQTNLAKRKIGVVPQEIILDVFFTVYESLEIYAGYYGIRPAMRKTLEIINSVGLTDKMHSKPRQLSGGMKRRLLVAKAMVHSPEVLILDEPSAGVDLNLREDLWNYLIKLNQSGTTIILTTHYLEEAEKLCDYVSFINKGKIIRTDKKENLFRNLGIKTISIETSSKIEQIPNNLTDYNPTIHNNILEFNFTPAEHTTGKIISEVVKAGIDITNVSISEPDLEYIFKKLII